MYAIKYFRDAKIVRWYEKRGIITRPVGWVIGTSRHATIMAAEKEAAHINALGPRVRVEVIRVGT